MVVLLKLILTVATALGTLVLLILNYRANKISNQTVEEMKRSREEEFRPYVYLDIVFEGQEMHILLKNAGKGVAYNTKLTMDQDVNVWTTLSPDKEYKLKDMGIGKEIEMLAPGEEFKEWMDVSFRFFKNNESHRLTGKVVYDNGAGRNFEFLVDLDLSTFADRVYSTEKGLDDLANLLERFQRDFDRNW